MIDFSRAFATVSDALQASSPTQENPADKLPAILSDTGHEPATQAGTAQDELVRLIA